MSTATALNRPSERFYEESLIPRSEAVETNNPATRLPLRVAIAERLCREGTRIPGRRWTRSDIGHLVVEVIVAAGYTVIPGTCLDVIKDLTVDACFLAREIMPAERRRF